MDMAQWSAAQRSALALFWALVAAVASLLGLVMLVSGDGLLWMHDVVGGALRLAIAAVCATASIGSIEEMRKYMRKGR